MAGHSKWEKNQYRKPAEHLKRDTIVTKLIRDTALATDAGGSADMAANASLQRVVNNILKATMRKKAIERAIKPASGDGHDVDDDAYAAAAEQVLINEDHSLAVMAQQNGAGA
ncbi:MAG: YebC/PmpR family DNA-binding transcriptional regulator [Gammaproteobacteria bacterium]|nr:YebC/PmpR family DNA-binding transcriptional regulator [Gammaproteobacteria bacterium]